MKKLIAFLLFSMVALTIFAQYTPRKLYGNYQFIVCDTTACDTIWLYPQTGSITLDTVVFDDGTKQSTAFVVGRYVEIDGDTMSGTYLLSSGSLNMGSGVNLNMSGGSNEINFSNTVSYSTKGVKITDEEIIMRSDWAGMSPLGILLKNDTIILTGGYIGGNIDTITSGGVSSSTTYTLKNGGFVVTAPTTTFSGRVNGLMYTSDSTSLADDASVVLTDAIYGWGEVYAFNAGAIDEWAEFIISADGTVYLKSNSTDVVNTDTDNKLCIFDNGSGVTIRNRLGGARTVKYFIYH